MIWHYVYVIDINERKNGYNNIIEILSRMRKVALLNCRKTIRSTLHHQRDQASNKFLEENTTKNDTTNITNILLNTTHPKNVVSDYVSYTSTNITTTYLPPPWSHAPGNTCDFKKWWRCERTKTKTKKKDTKSHESLAILLKVKQSCCCFYLTLLYMSVTPHPLLWKCSKYGDWQPEHSNFFW